jgi:hypothetical protein
VLAIEWRGEFREPGRCNYEYISVAAGFTRLRRARALRPPQTPFLTFVSFCQDIRVPKIRAIHVIRGSELLSPSFVSIRGFKVGDSRKPSVKYATANEIEFLTIFVNLRLS